MLREWNEKIDDQEQALVKLEQANSTTIQW